MLCAILFAGLANLIVVILPHQYSASTDLQIVFEPGQDINWTDKYMLSFTEEIGGVLEDPTIMAAVIDSLSDQGYLITEKDIARSFSKERRFYGWKLTVTSDDAAWTQAALNTWKTTTLAAIQHDRDMGLAAQQQRALALAWVPCLQQLIVEPIHPVCNPANAMTISSLQNEAYDQYEATSSGIRFLTDYPPQYSVTEMAPQAVSPTSRLPRAVAIFTGSLLGILVGALTIQQPWTRFLQIKRGVS